MHQRLKEAVTLEEIYSIAASPARTLLERRARAAAVFLFLSGMRIGRLYLCRFQAVDIPNRKITQYPSLGVRTKNRKYGITYLLDIPELLKVVQEWDDEVRAILPPNGFWFAPFSPDTGKIDANIFSIGEHRDRLARRNIKTWLTSVGLRYHSPHKFRHGHIHYGSARSKTIEDFKAVSMNVMHSSMKITDEFYSNLNSDEIQKRIERLGEEKENTDYSELQLFKEFLNWKNNNYGKS